MREIAIAIACAIRGARAVRLRLCVPASCACVSAFHLNLRRGPGEEALGGGAEILVGPRPSSPTRTSARVPGELVFVIDEGTNDGGRCVAPCCACASCGCARPAYRCGCCAQASVTVRDLELKSVMQKESRKWWHGAAAAAAKWLPRPRCLRGSWCSAVPAAGHRCLVHGPRRAFGIVSRDE